jgi:hypothetical protein
MGKKSFFRFSPSTYNTLYPGMPGNCEPVELYPVFMNSTPKKSLKPLSEIVLWPTLREIAENVLRENLKKKSETHDDDAINIHLQ